MAAQTKDWMVKKKYFIFDEIFSCQNPQDLIGEFFFLIASLYSTEGDIQKSNFYLKISNYLNPKFKFNLSLFVENYYEIENFELSESFLKAFQNDSPIYYWYKLKKKAEIIKKEKDENSSFDFILSEFNKIKSPSQRVILDMANIAKNFEKYDLSIIYYSKLLLNLDQRLLCFMQIYFIEEDRAFERLGQYKKADTDFLELS